MTDRELQRLIGMAMEAEDLERSAAFEHPPLRLAGGTGGWRRWATGLGVATAAAASLALAMIVVQGRLSPRPLPPLAHGNPTAPRTAPADALASSGAGEVHEVAGSDDQCMLMAVFRNGEGQCSCVQLQPHTWEQGRKLADVGSPELIHAAMQEACIANPHQVLVLAVEGKSGGLPHSREEAEAIATKLAEAPGRHGDLTSYAYEAIPGLPRDATVVAERVSVRPASPLKAAAEQVHLPIEWETRADVH